MGFSFHEWDDVTVIVPSLNAEQTIERALKSVERQTVRAQRIIVVDGGSSDNTIAVAQKVAAMDGWNTPIDIYEEDGISLGASRNAALRRVGTDFIAFLDADDEWHKMKLQKSLEAIRSDDSLAFVAHDVMVHKRNGRKYFKDATAPYEKSPNKKIGLFLEDYIHTSTIVARTADVRKVQGFHGKLCHGITQDLLLKLIENRRRNFKVFKGGYTIYHESCHSLSTRILPTLHAQEYFSLAHVRSIAEHSYIPPSFLVLLRFVKLHSRVLAVAGERGLWAQLVLLCMRSPYALVKMLVMYTFRLHGIYLPEDAMRTV